MRASPPQRRPRVKAAERPRRSHPGHRAVPLHRRQSAHDDGGEPSPGPLVCRATRAVRKAGLSTSAFFFCWRGARSLHSHGHDGLMRDGESSTTNPARPRAPDSGAGRAGCDSLRLDMMMPLGVIRKRGARATRRADHGLRRQVCLRFYGRSRCGWSRRAQRRQGAPTRWIPPTRTRRCARSPRIAEGAIW